MFRILLISQFANKFISIICHERNYFTPSGVMYNLA